MTFEELWTKVQGLPDTAMMQVPGVLSAETKRRLAKNTPEKVAQIVRQAIEEVNHGSIEPLDTLIKKRL